MPTPIRRSHRRVALGVVCAVVIFTACSDGGSATATRESKGSTTTDVPTTTTIATERAAGITSLVLDPTHDYGNLYASGILPVGDNKYVTDAAKQGWVYLCRAPQGDAGGAQARGPWFSADGTTYDVKQKIAVEGNVPWDGSLSITVASGKRVVTTNDLPKDHTTGEFPVSSSDLAYAYDRNPNHIAAQSLTYSLTANPGVAATPSCVGGEAGVMTTGVALFNAFDAGGRDAGAWEVQDGCNGHPQMTSEYHYHTLSACIQDTSVATVIGYALDGFPITGPKVGSNNILTTRDLDECHGITSAISLDGTLIESYHYVMTQDFPYSVSCFRATPIAAPRSG